jgi:hypothetical protein
MPCGVVRKSTFQMMGKFTSNPENYTIFLTLKQAKMIAKLQIYFSWKVHFNFDKPPWFYPSIDKNTSWLDIRNNESGF